MDLIDRFSTHLKMILSRAVRLAGDLNNPAVEPLHLLCALQMELGSVAGEILKQHKIEQKILEQAISALPTTPLIDKKEGTTIQKTVSPLSGATRLVLERAMLLAEENGHNYVGSEHLLLALIRHADPMIDKVMADGKIKINELEKQLSASLANASQFPRLNEAAEAARRIQENFGEDSPSALWPTSNNARSAQGKESVLDFFAIDLCSPETQKTIDPLIGRQGEVERLIQILSRRAKNNPILLGEPGVGKTAIVEGLARRIVSGDVPHLLLNKKIYALDMGLLIAGAIYRGEFEARLRQVIDEVTDNPDIILFIDEAHNIVGAGSNQGTLDASNILKPALARGQIRCIGATTPAEFKKYIESDAALERRFQPIMVKEPSLEETIQIMEGIKDNYQTYHQVKITSAAVAAAARLADRYISNKFMPDKAVDLLDEAAAAKKLSAKPSALHTKLHDLRRALQKTVAEKNAAAKKNKLDEAAEIKKEETALRNKIKEAEAAIKKTGARPLGTVDESDIIKQLAKTIGVPASELLFEEKNALLGLEEKLKQRVIGQENAIQAVARLVRQARLGLSSANRPLASFLFVGESGTGKTELAKTLAGSLYPSGDALITVNMSELNEGHSVSKLLGSPAGYVGFKEANQFTDRVKLNPHSVILFDEADKAHPDVLKLLLQMLENGEINDATGKKISLKHAIIILTTSLGAEEAAKSAFGFSGEQNILNENAKRVTEKLKNFFSPELINRLDQICIFNRLAPGDLASIARLELQELNERLTRYRTELIADEKILEWIVGQINYREGGARNIRREVRGRVEKLIADVILSKDIKPAYSLKTNGNELMIK